MQPGTKQGQPGTRQGHPWTKQGQTGTKQGQPGTKRGQGHNWTNADQAKDTEKNMDMNNHKESIN